MFVGLIVCPESLLPIVMPPAIYLHISASGYKSYILCLLCTFLCCSQSQVYHHRFYFTLLFALAETRPWPTFLSSTGGEACESAGCARVSACVSSVSMCVGVTHKCVCWKERAVWACILVTSCKICLSLWVTHVTQEDEEGGWRVASSSSYRWCVCPGVVYGEWMLLRGCRHHLWEAPWEDLCCASKLGWWSAH